MGLCAASTLIVHLCITSVLCIPASSSHAAPPPSHAAAKQAVEQLALTARVLVFAVYAANAPMLASCGPLTVHGTAAFFEKGADAEYLAGTTVDVGAPPRAKESALPAAVGTVMLIIVEYLYSF